MATTSNSWVSFKQTDTRSTEMHSTIEQWIDDLVARLTDAADELGVTVRIVPEDEWTHGEAKGICEQVSLVDAQPLVEVRDRANDADLARTLIHEFAHALLHFDVEDDTEIVRERLGRISTTAEEIIGVLEDGA